MRPPFTFPDRVPTQSLATDELLSGLAHRMERLRSLRSLYSISYSSRNERGRFRGAILVRRPDRLRLETLSMVGAVLVLTANGDEVVGFLPREKIIYRGKSSKANLFRFTQIPLELKELTSILLGLPPVKVEGSWQRDGSTLLRRFSWGGEERIEFDPGTSLPLRWNRLNADGENELTAVFSEFVFTSMGSFPLKISLQHTLQERSWEIRYNEPELNVEIPVPLFVQQKPSHVREVLLESLGG